MINILDIVPIPKQNLNSQCPAEKQRASTGSQVSKLVIFYIGMAMLIVISMIPPFTLMMPFIIPIVLGICMIVNGIYFMKFLQILQNKFDDTIGAKAKEEWCKSFPTGAGCNIERMQGGM
jgi:hypothetical protein